MKIHHEPNELADGNVGRAQHGGAAANARTLKKLHLLSAARQKGTVLPEIQMVDPHEATAKRFNQRSDSQFHFFCLLLLQMRNQNHTMGTKHTFCTCSCHLSPISNGFIMVSFHSFSDVGDFSSCTHCSDFKPHLL